MSDARFAARAREARRQRLKRVGLAVLVVVVASSMVWIIWFSTLLAVRSVTVDGETTLRESQILQAASVRRGEPLVRIDIASIEARVAALARIETVKVSRSWPHTISIDVVERRAVIWASIGGEVRGIDRFGIDFRTYSSAPKKLLEAKISVVDRTNRFKTTQAVADVVNVIATKDPALRKQMRSISAESLDSIQLELTKGRTVVWGSKAKGERKLEVLRSLLRIDAARYDVSAPDQPTTRD